MCPTYAMLDTGANCSAVTEDICETIGAEISNLDIKLAVFGHESTKSRAVTSVSVFSLKQDFHINLKNALVGDYISRESEKPPRAEELKKFKHLKNVTLNDLDDLSVGVLLDAKYAWAFMTGEIKNGEISEPMAVRSKFGWALV